MARIPGVPNIDPVNQPTMNPAEAGRVGEAISQSGEGALDDSLQQQGLNLYMKKAQEHVDTLAARNEMDAAYADIQNQLSKTQNSRDIPDVIQQGNKTLNDISSQWSKSPAAIAIQMDTDALRPSLSRVGTVRQVDLMGKELKINLNQQGERLAGDYAAGNRDAAVAAFGTAVGGGVSTGLLGDAEAGEYMRQFKAKGQELEIKNGISNANPAVNQQTYDKISTSGKEAYPELTGEQLDVYKGQALSAFESHTRMQEWAEGQMAQNTMLRPLIDLHTNPATKQFDVEGARADAAAQFKDGKITSTQLNVLETGLKGYQADVSGEQEKQAGQFQDSVIKMFHDHKYSDAYAALEKQRPILEQNGMSDLYKSMMNYGDSQRREERAEQRAEYTLGREQRTLALQEQAETSNSTLYSVLADMSGGKIYTDDQLRSIAGQGEGKMLTADVNKAITASHSYQKDQNYGAAVDLMMGSFGVPKDSSPQTVSIAHAKYAKTFEAWQQRVNENPSADKLKLAKEVMEPVIQEQIGDQINKIFGVEKPVGFFDRLKASEAKFKSGDPIGAVTGLFNSKPATTPKPDSGTIRVKEKSSGRTGTIPASEFDANTYEKVQ